MQKLAKLRDGDKVAILSPSSAAPAVWPHVHELGLQRLRDVFKLEPVEFPTTRKLGATTAERAADLTAAFENPEIKGIIASIGGDDQVTYVKNLPPAPFANNPKPFFGFSDNTHFANFLWLNGVPSFYGGSLFTQFAMQKRMDEYTVKYLQYALFDGGEQELEQSAIYNDVGLDWSDPATLQTERTYEKNDGWQWDGAQSAEGITWGGCVESIDEMLRHGVPIPSLEQFENVVLLMETSEELPAPSYVRRVYRALGERGILGRVKGLLAGRAKAWEFDKPNTPEQKAEYRKELHDMTTEIVRHYNTTAPIIQNMDFGHTDPQIPMPYGGPIKIYTAEKTVKMHF